MNKPEDIIDRNMLYEESLNFQELVGKPLAAYSYEEILAAYLKQHKIEETVNVSSNLVAVKVLSTIIEGARFNGAKWRNLVNLHKATEEQEKVPIFTENDFKVRKGTNRPPVQSGGDVTEIQFDFTKRARDRDMWVSFHERDIERKKFNLIQNSLRMAGQAFSKFILDEVLTFINDNATSTRALGADDRFTAVTDLVATMENAGFPAEAAAIDPPDFAQVLQTQVGTAGPMPFITNTMVDKSGDNVRKLKFGEDYMLLGYIPGIKAVNTTLSGNIQIVNKSSVNFGMFKDITIKNWEDPIKSLKGFSIHAVYELVANTKLNAGMGLVTGA